MEAVEFNIFEDQPKDSEVYVVGLERGRKWRKPEATIKAGKTKTTHPLRPMPQQSRGLEDVDWEALTR